MYEKGYNGLDWIILVMNRGGGASEMIDLIHLKQDRLNHIVANELKLRITKMVHQILFPTSEEVIDHNHTVPSIEQFVDQMAPDESRAARDHNAAAGEAEANRYALAGGGGDGGWSMKDGERAEVVGLV